MPPLTPGALRQWRGLDDLSRDPAFVERATAEFPMLAQALAEPRGRRSVLRLMAASLALAGLTGCDDGGPSGVLIPPVLPPADAISAGSGMYATASVVSGYANGILVRHKNERPIKVEGNPLHPASLGATSAIGQAEILGFYDPDRSRGVIRDGEPQSWSSLLTALAERRAALAASYGEGFRVLTGTTTSPTLARQMAALRQLYPAMQWHQAEPISRDSVRAGSVLAYGHPVEVVPKLAAADVLVTFDSDLLESAPGHLRFARDYSSRRNPARSDRMNRAWAIEPSPTLTGVCADERQIAGPQDVVRIVAALSAGVLHGGSASGMPGWFQPLLADLTAAHGRAFLHAGPAQPAEVHALVHAMNEVLGGRGTTYDLIETVQVDPVDQGQSLRSLIADMAAGRVSTLLVLDSNPVFAAPGFADALRHVAFSMTLSTETSETAGKTHWSVPSRHPFEDWSDARAFDGTVTILQPQAQPLFDGISPHSVLALFAGPTNVDSRSLVRQTWDAAWPGDKDQQWHDAVAAGVVPNTQAAVSRVPLKPEAGRLQPSQPAAADVTLLLRPDPHLWDGRYANNGWLQELPRPLTKITWDNPLLVSSAIAKRLDLKNGDRVQVTTGSASVTMPAWVMPGQAADCVVGLLGYGRHDVGAVGQDIGYDLYQLTAGAAHLTKVDGTLQLASTEHHDPLFEDAQAFIRHGTLAAFKANPDFLGKPPDLPELYNREPPGPAVWGMSIDLNACIGCNACVVACQAENNIPVVGKQQVIHEREMHWLRIDRYYERTPEAPDTLFQPVLCQHCEQAPCEIVCPVGATMHDSEGLNVMVYNRCVGTRFCSNNCPYKVRRFNYYAFADQEQRPALARNPDVSVRARGVMEKCTFCLQRIAAARIDADAENRPIGADEVRTACQAACPTQAFSFGNQAVGGEVRARKASKLSYALLEDQNTRPRVTYEAKIRNRAQEPGA